MRERRLTLILVTVALLATASVAPGIALADPGRPGLNDASRAVYPGGATEQTLHAQTGEEVDASGPSGKASGLPFTGLSAPAILAVGLLVLVLGLSLRAVVSSRRSNLAASNAR